MISPISQLSSNNLAGDNSEEATPDPIPNSEVKLFCVDGTAWVTVWESRTSPAFFVFGARLRRRFVVRVPSTHHSLHPGIHRTKNKNKLEVGSCAITTVLAKESE